MELPTWFMELLISLSFEGLYSAVTRQYKLAKLTYPVGFRLRLCDKWSHMSGSVAHMRITTT